MSRRFVPLLFLLFSISWAVVSAQDCPAIVKNALARAQTACAIMRTNQACYGYPALEAQLQEGLSPFAFNGVGDITPVDTIQSLHMSALDPVKDEWGVALMRVHADISADHPNQNVTLLAFGEVSIDPDKSASFQPMQAFALQTGDTQSGCTDITENGLIIQTPEGIGRVTLWINDVRVRVGSTALFQAQPGGNMTVSTFEGRVEVQAHGGTQEAAAGMQVRVPMDEELHPTGAPTAPEPFDTTNPALTSVEAVVDVSTSYTDGTVVQLIPTSDTSGSVTDAGNTGGLDNPSGGGPNDPNGGCNGDHGNGNGNGNCNGHDNQSGNGNGNNGNGNGNGGGNGNGNNGNGNGNGGGNGNGNNGNGNGKGNGNG